MHAVAGGIKWGWIGGMINKTICCWVFRGTLHARC